MYRYEDFRQSLNNYLEIDYNWPDCCDIEEMMKCNRDAIFKLSSAFEHKYNFKLLDIEIEIIWRWHSVDWDASWLIVGDADRDMMFFDKFVERFK